jgi:hypothetical protein
MGNSSAMIERHYSKLTATMAAEMLALHCYFSVELKSKNLLKSTQRAEV